MRRSVAADKRFLSQIQMQSTWHVSPSETVEQKFDIFNQAVLDIRDQ
jgi:hypothetical protein